MSYVTPDSWLKVPQAKKLRQLVLNKTSPFSITVLPQKVFTKVSANCIVFVLLRGKPTNGCSINVLLPHSQLSDLARNRFDDRYEVKTAVWKASDDVQFQIFQKKEVAGIISRVWTMCSKALEHLDVMQGIVPYSREQHSQETIKRRAFHAAKKASGEYGIWI
jgi:hypothetical protein